MYCHSLYCYIQYLISAEVYHGGGGSSDNILYNSRDNVEGLCQGGIEREVIDVIAVFNEAVRHNRRLSFRPGGSVAWNVQFHDYLDPAIICVCCEDFQVFHGID